LNLGHEEHCEPRSTQGFFYPQVTDSVRFCEGTWRLPRPPTRFVCFLTYNSQLTKYQMVRSQIIRIKK